LGSQLFSFEATFSASWSTFSQQSGWSFKNINQSSYFSVLESSNGFPFCLLYLK
jgi:hypothetical protein